MTLTIGDYLLTPDCAVERKSISDLIQSLNSGRLHTQATALTAAYSQAVLLIEFEEQFNLLASGELRGEIETNSILSKLCLLVLHHPKLRLLWSPNLQATANLFEDLKRGKPDPPSLEECTVGDARFNEKAKEMLLAMPGVTAANVYGIMRHAKNMRELVTLSQDQLKERLGMNTADAKRLHDFLHKRF